MLRLSSPADDYKNVFVYFIFQLKIIYMNESSFVQYRIYTCVYYIFIFNSHYWSAAGARRKLYWTISTCIIRSYYYQSQKTTITTTQKYLLCFIVLIECSWICNYYITIRVKQCIYRCDHLAAYVQYLKYLTYMKWCVYGSWRTKYIQSEQQINEKKKTTVIWFHL